MEWHRHEHDSARISRASVHNHIKWIKERQKQNTNTHTHKQIREPFLIILPIFDQNGATSTFPCIFYIFFLSLLSWKWIIWFIQSNKIIHCFFIKLQSFLSEWERDGLTNISSKHRITHLLSIDWLVSIIRICRVNKWKPKTATYWFCWLGKERMI